MISQFGNGIWISSFITVRSVGALLVPVLMLMVSAGCGSTARTTSPPGADDPDVVASFADNILTLDDFERQYARSSGNRDAAAGDSLADYRDFLERFVNFRLKVAAANEAGIPEQPEVRDEISAYRSRLARPYLLDREVVEPIVAELYERRQQFVDVSHILVRIPPEAVPSDTLAVFRRLEAVRDSLIQGAEFGELAIRHSEDPSASGSPGSPGYRGRLGYFTGGNLVEPFESFAYETPVGAISPIFRTQFGYHVLKVHDRRSAIQDIRLSHIMIRPESTAEDSARVRGLLQDLKTRIDEGADFAALAREHSEDQQSTPRGGDIGTVSYTVQLPEAFKEAAFALEEVGDVSGTVETSFGFHLIQLTGREEPATYEESYEELKGLANRLPRMRAAEEELARDILNVRGARIDTARVIEAFAGLSPDTIATLLIAERLPERILADTFFVLGDTSFTIRELADADSHDAVATARDMRDFVHQLVSSFATQKAIDYEALRLEDRDPEFRRLMTEFRDGLVLFEFMEDSVWTVAERDSAALRAYYDEHAASYRWPERTRVISLQSSSDSLLETVVNRLDSGVAIPVLSETFAGDSLTALQVDTTMIADSTYAVYDRALGLSHGEHTAVLPYQGSYIVLVNDGVEPPRGKTFEEARASVVSAYQQVVEEELIQRLRRRYSAHTFPERLERAYQDDQEGAAASAAAAPE